MRLFFFKVVVRNIQEDNSVVPVAFMDMNMYVSESKSLKYMVLLSDAVRSVWLVGFGVSWKFSFFFSFANRFFLERAVSHDAFWQGLPGH